MTLLHSPNVRSLDSYGTLTGLNGPDQGERYFSLAKLAATYPEVARLPIGLCILLENLLRHEDGELIGEAEIAAVAQRSQHWGSDAEILYYPSRVVMQDYSGLVALIDVATMRDKVAAAGGMAESVNPVKPVDLIIDHSMVVQHAGHAEALEQNLVDEYRQNRERFSFLKWTQTALDNLRIVPPGNGIIHQINLEHIAQVVARDTETNVVFPESQIGTDSHTTMINGLGVLAWGVGGIEAEAALLGEPVSMLVPDVVGVRLTGSPKPGVLATDVVLAITECLRKVGVVEKFVEFFGPGVAALAVGDRATIANMAPEYGATCGLFPIDDKVIDYLLLTGRSPAAAKRTKAYARANGLWDDGRERDYAEVIEFDLAAVTRSAAGPRNPHQRFTLADRPGADSERVVAPELGNGDVVIAAITSCTNTSNPRNMMAAGLLARKARARGLRVSSKVKTSLSPGSRAVTRYLDRAGLLQPLAELGFDVVGYGCATCVGNSGPLSEAVATQIKASELDVAAVLSGNRNFEGRIHAQIKSNFLVSPPMVVAFALSGTVDCNIEQDVIGQDQDGEPVYLADIWPSDEEIDAAVLDSVSADLYREGARTLDDGGPEWRSLKSSGGPTFEWTDDSSYISPSPFFDPQHAGALQIERAVPLLVLGDNVTTDHISPVGSIEPQGPAAQELRRYGVETADFNSYGARRGNAEVMRRGTFANVRLRNRLVSVEGGFTRYAPDGQTLPISEAASLYRQSATDMVVVAGKNYGTGSARDWAAKGTAILGVKAVIAESFERIHRANLVLSGVLPLEFIDPVVPDVTRDTRISIDLPESLRPRQHVTARFEANGETVRVQMLVRIDTALEMRYFAAGGILPFILTKLVEKHT